MDLVYVHRKMSKPTVHDSVELEPHWTDDDWGIEIPLDDEEIAKQGEEGPSIFAKFKALLSRLFSTNDKNEGTAESEFIEEPPKQVYIAEPVVYECQPSAIPSNVTDFVAVDLFAVDSEMPKNETRRKNNNHKRKCRSSKQHGIRAQSKG